MADKIAAPTGETTAKSESAGALGYDRSNKDDAEYEAVTLEDVKRAAEKTLSEDKFVISVVKLGSEKC